ncbi:hypothetical protein OIE66_17340 [Nonomuraea sp. NBC_01738]|uniref:hypothetical protein n=1 Tax=Nonomuraea sp. NBC_01738 TaxID=2976003 RepID=UPI002E0EA6A2|nr:hypothetical protein OIE66_17340 [Nonomuraea sp. NBC_01738]
MKKLALTCAAVTLAMTGLLVSPAHADSGLFRIFNADLDESTGDCLDSSTGDVISIECNDKAGKRESGWQLWRISFVDNVPGLVMFENVKYPGRCLAGRGTGSNGVVLAGCTVADSSQWWWRQSVNFPVSQSITSYVGNYLLYDEVGTLDVRLAPSVNPYGRAQWVISPGSLT